MRFDKFKKSTLSEQALLDKIKPIPLMLMSQAEPSRNVNINNYCNKLINLDITAQAVGLVSIGQFEQNITLKRNKTSNKTKYHKKCVKNVQLSITF